MAVAGSTTGEPVADYLPDEITAGVTLDHNITLTAYPATDWSLSVILRGPQAIDIAATAGGDTHVLSVDAATTSSWPPGAYQFSMRVTDGTDTFEVDSGRVRIVADLSQVTGEYDPRGHVDRVLEAIEAVIEGRATKDQRRYRINNRELERTPIGELLMLRDKYKTEARRLRANDNNGQSLLGRPVRVRF